MSKEVLQVISPGLSATVQDRGRSGWRRFGVPPGGSMDRHASEWGNRLLDNPPGAPVLELLMQGAKFEVRCDVWLAITGADMECSLPLWRATRVTAGALIEFPRLRKGLWSYLAIEGGFAGERWLGSASVCPRAGLGAALQAGDVLSTAPRRPFELPAGVASRITPPVERRNYDLPPPLRVWPAPQTRLFSAEDQQWFFSARWTVSSQSDRVGYRLEGPPLTSRLPPLISEPVRVGTVQVPDNGLPIVTMRDGPTVGGYPKIGVLDPDDVSWLAQCRLGQAVGFRCVDEH